MDKSQRARLQQQLADKLPEGMNWGDPLTPDLLLEILSHVRVTGPNREAGMQIKINREGARFWHENCASHFGGIMMEIKQEPDKSLIECQHCKQRGYYPVGGVGRVSVNAISGDENEISLPLKAENTN